METNRLGTLRKSEIIGGLIYLPMFLVGSQILAVLIVGAMGVDLDADEASAPINLAFGILNVLALGLIFRRYLRGQLRVAADRGFKLFTDTVRGVLLYYLLSIAAGMLADLLTELFQVSYYNANQEAVEDAMQAVPWMIIVVVSVLAPFAEELLCRGLVFCGLYRRSRFWAYALSMLLFSAIHVYASVLDQPLAVSLISLVVYLPAGFVLARAYERSGTIWTSIFLHSVINMTALLLQRLM